MVVLATNPPLEAPMVLKIPGVPLTPQVAQLRAEILSRFEDLSANMEDAESMQFWNEGTYFAFKPRNSWYDWLTKQVAILMMRINRAERIERRLRDLQALRAIDCWEFDQVHAAATLGASLALDPKRVVGELWTTSAGCEWLIDRWESLAAVPAADWTEAQQTLARQIDPVAPHHYLTPGYARMRIGNLEVARDRLRAADQALQTLTQSDLSPVPSRLLVELRKYTRSLHRQLKWFVAQLRIEPPKREPDPRYRPNFIEPEAEPEPDAEPTPPPTDQTNPNSPGEVPESDQTNPDRAAGVVVADRTNPISTPVADRTNPPAVGLTPVADRTNPPAVGLTPVADRTNPILTPR